MNAEWRTYKLEELCEFINGFAFKSTDYVDPSNATYEVLRQWNYPQLQSMGELHNHKWSDVLK